MYFATSSTVYKVVSTAGPMCDIDADGYGDTVVGVPGETLQGVTEAGGIHVFYGSDVGLLASDDQFITQDTAGIAGISKPGDRFGHAVACADFDGDGFDDVAVGVPGKRLGASEDAGAVTIVPGTASGLDPTGSVRFHQDTSKVKNVAEPGDEFGFSLAVGDFNADGIPDLAVGVPGESIGGISTGLVQVFMGGGTLRPKKWNAVFAQSWSGLPGVHDEGDRFGHALVGADFDGDGDDDLAIGIPGEPGGGAVQIMKAKGKGLAQTQQLRTAVGVAGLGFSLAAGATNPDGLDDLVAGAPDSDGEAGAVVVFGGRAWGVAGQGDVYRQGDGLWNTPEAGDRFGAAVGTVRPAKSGLDATLVGAPGEALGGQPAGIVHVLFAGDDGPSRVGDKLLKPGALAGTLASYEALGAAIRAGDTDGDGDQDVVIGDPADGGQILIVGAESGGFVRPSSRLVDQDSIGVANVREAGDEFGGAL